MKTDRHNTISTLFQSAIHGILPAVARDAETRDITMACIALVEDVDAAPGEDSHALLMLGGDSRQEMIVLLSAALRSLQGDANEALIPRRQ